MKNSAKLTRILIEMTEQPLSDQDINALYDIISEMAYRILKKKVYNNNYYFNIINSNDNYLKEEAISIIAVLFRTNDRGELHELADYFLPKIHRIEACPEESFYWLRKLVSSKLRQELIHRFKQEDVEGFRLYRNLMLSPNRHPHIGKFTINYRKYFYYDDGTTMTVIYNRKDNPITRETLLQWLDEIPMEKATAPNLLLQLLQRCRQQMDVQNYISFSILLSCFKAKNCTRHFDYDESMIRKSGPLSINEYERKLLFNKIQTLMEEILNKTYINRQKVTNGERNIYLTIVMEYFDDLIHTGKVKLLPKYLNQVEGSKQLNGAWQHHRSRIEYMIKQGKKYLQELIIPI